MRQTFVALAPIRICDLGGWSDTWFAKHGSVLNIAVSPYAECRLEVRDSQSGEDRFYISVDDYGDRYRIDPHNVTFGKHPLLEACVKSLKFPRGMDVEVSLHSSVPGGSSTGTSASVTVALLAALNCISESSTRLSQLELARVAHEVETVHLGQQSGIQDQICSSHGGISFIEMDEYPHSRVHAVPVSDGMRETLDQHLELVFLGHTHHSSSVHATVIQGLLENRGGDRLEPLRQEAVRGRDALMRGDLSAFGQCMIRNTEAQAELHPSLVSAAARRVFEVARKYDAFGWKVNGAGGDGGSVTLLSSLDMKKRRAMLDEINSLGDGIRTIGIRLDNSGVRVLHG